MLHTNPTVMRAQTDAYLPKTTTVEGFVLRGTARPVRFSNRPNFLQRLLASLRRPRSRKSARPLATHQPSLSRR